jgi:hypothetical protein
VSLKYSIRQALLHITEWNPYFIHITEWKPCFRLIH